MILLLMIITIMVIVFLFFIEWEEFALIPIGALIFELIVFLFFCGCLVSTRTIDKQIKLYEKQNKEIESKIEITVKQYMDYEESTYKDLKNESYIQLVNLYPELKADKLVQQQIDTYTKNNEKIISLKEIKINKTIYKWWLYFGK